MKVIFHSPKELREKWVSKQLSDKFLWLRFRMIFHDDLSSMASFNVGEKLDEKCFVTRLPAIINFIVWHKKLEIASARGFGRTQKKS